MEKPTPETSENSSVLPVISTETTETLDQSIMPPVAPPQTIETSELSPPPVTNLQAAETSPPQDTNTESTENLEQSTLPEVTNTQASEPLEESTPLAVTNTPTTETLDHSILPPLTNTMTTETTQQSVIPSEVIDNSHENLVASSENHQDMEMRQETIEHEMRQETIEEEEEIKSVLKGIAATGKFWQDWEKLRSMISLHLKQVISEYPQAKLTIQEQRFSLGETHAELVKRLDDALHSFIEGPPFTLQRLSEIILDARSLYPNLSKLALALEKNLSVTSTLTISTDPYTPSLVTTPNGLDKENEDPNPNPNPEPNLIVNPNANANAQLQSDAVMENGVPPVAADGDEVMMEVEGDVMTMDMETYEKPSESSPMTTVPDIVGISRLQATVRAFLRSLK